MFFDLDSLFYAKPASTKPHAPWGGGARGEVGGGGKQQLLKHVQQENWALENASLVFPMRILADFLQHSPIVKHLFFSP